MIYLDCAATTQPYVQALLEFNEVSSKTWENPSSRLYSKKAAGVLENSRATIASILDVPHETILFTSGSTEAANWVIAQPWQFIVTTELEHPCVYNSVIHSNAHCLIVKNDTTGKVDLENLVEILDWTSNFGGTTLVAIMGANNELGTINPVTEIADIVSCYKHTKYFCDATQLWPHEKIEIGNIDFACMSAHKFGGLKGTGFLYAKDPSALKPLFYGGHQEYGLRAGTENVGGIAAMAKALQITEEYKADFKASVTKIRKFILSHDQYKFNGGNDCVQNIVSMTMPDCDAQKMVAALGKDEIYLSAGSACNTGSTEPSRVLTAIGMSEEEANRTLRISFDAKVRNSDIREVFEKIEYYREVLM